jgi:hypothetical protein
MVLSSSSGVVTFLLKKMILGNLNLTGSEHMICEFQKQHELDYTDRRKAMDEKNVSTALDNTSDDIQEARDDNNQPWFDKGNARSEFPVSSVHESIKSARKSVREDLELR